MVEIWSYFLDFSSESTCPWGAKQGMVATLSTRGGEAPSFLQLEEPWKGDQLPSPTVSLKYAPLMPAAPFFFFEPCVFPPFLGWRRCSLPLIPLLRPFLFAFFLIFQQQEKVPLPPEHSREFAWGGTLKNGCDTGRTSGKKSWSSV